MFSGIDHIDMAVDDPARMAEFLKQLGFVELRWTEAGGGAVELRFPGGDDQPIFEIRPTTTADGRRIPAGIRHIALRTSDAEAAYQALSAKGVTFNGPPRHVPTTGRTLANIIDPEGHPLQFVTGPR